MTFSPPPFPFAAMCLAAAEKAKQYGSGHINCSLISSHQLVTIGAYQALPEDQVAFVYRVDGIRVDEDEITRILHNWE